MYLPNHILGRRKAIVLCYYTKQLFRKKENQSTLLKKVLANAQPWKENKSAKGRLYWLRRPCQSSLYWLPCKIIRQCNLIVIWFFFNIGTHTDKKDNYLRICSSLFFSGPVWLALTSHLCLERQSHANWALILSSHTPFLVDFSLILYVCRTAEHLSREFSQRKPSTCLWRGWLHQ